MWINYELQVSVGGSANSGLVPFEVNRSVCSVHDVFNSMDIMDHIDLKGAEMVPRS